VFASIPGTILKQALQIDYSLRGKGLVCPLRLSRNIDGFGDTNRSFSGPLRVCVCGARIAEAKTLAMPSFANNAGTNLSCCVLLAKHPLVLARGSAESVEPA
jgi:hypothetical protein